MTLLVLFEEVCVKKNWLGLYMLWFKFILGLKFFELVSILFAKIIVMNTQQKKIKVQPVWKILHQN